MIPSGTISFVLKWSGRCKACLTFMFVDGMTRLLPTCSKRFRGVGAFPTKLLHDTETLNLSCQCLRVQTFVLKNLPAPGLSFHTAGKSGPLRAALHPRVSHASNLPRTTHSPHSSHPIDSFLCATRQAGRLSGFWQPGEATQVSSTRGPQAPCTGNEHRKFVGLDF